MTGARPEDRADIAQKSRSVLGGWWAFYRRPIVAGGHVRSFLAHRLIGVVGQPVLDENVVDTRTAKALGAAHDPKDQSGGAKIAADGIVNDLSEGNLPMGRDLDSATLSILDWCVEQALDALSNRRLFALRTALRVARDPGPKARPPGRITGTS